jgi:integrase
MMPIALTVKIEAKKAKHYSHFFAHIQSRKSSAERLRGRVPIILSTSKKSRRHLGCFPTGALSDRRARDEFLTWRDKLAQSSLRQAEYTLVVFAAILAWAKNRGKIPVNPLERIGRIYNGNRAEIIWRDEDEAAFMRVASAPMRLAMMLALWTGQRQGDLLRLTWAAYDGAWIRIAQSKTGVRLSIPVGKPLRDVLDLAKRQSPFILANSDGAPWTPDGFRSS